MVLNDIHPDAKIGKNVTVGNFTTICEDVEIGDGTWIAPNVTIFPGARIGKNCKIFPGSVIAAIPQDLKFAGEYTTVEIGDNNVIRECCTINRGTAASGKTVIGNGNLLMAYVLIFLSIYEIVKKKDYLRQKRDPSFKVRGYAE